jgi:hypothetical protein
MKVEKKAIHADATADFAATAFQSFRFPLRF